MFKLGKNKIVRKIVIIKYDGDYFKMFDVNLGFLEKIYPKVDIRNLSGGININATNLWIEFTGPKCEVEKIRDCEVIYRVYKEYPHLLEEGQFHKLLKKS